MKLITTSWDDGHPLDFRIADLLEKYNLPGTFYIPKKNTGCLLMSEKDVVQLSKTFEIGGHTLSHINLSAISKWKVQEEIKGSYQWLEGLTGLAPVSFCFPLGKFNATSINSVFETGYRVARTTELLSLRHFDNKQLTPTTLQLYEHTRFTYLRHLLKRRRIINLARWFRIGSSNIIKLTEAYLKDIIQNDGCFHLWGHSWEIEQNSLWKKLEDVLKIISNLSDFNYIQNRDILLF